MVQRKNDIHKAAGILLKDKKFLVTRSKDKNFFISPGGKVELDETNREALIRELKEELNIAVGDIDLKEFGTFYAPAAGSEDKFLQMDVFLVAKWSGEITPASEVEEIRWIDSATPLTFELGSIFLHDVLPKLKEQNLIN